MGRYAGSITMVLLVRWCVPFLAMAASPLAAQIGLNESRGPLSGASTAVAIDGATFATDALARMHRNGLQSGPLVDLPVGTPSLGQILLAIAPPGLDLDDFSLGRDDVLFDASGTTDVAPSSWGVLSFSLRTPPAALLSGLAGSRIRQEFTQGSIGAALFSWTYFGSALPASLVDRTERSHSRRELGLAALTAEVDAIDFPLMLGRDQQTMTGEEPGFDLLNPYPHAIYFTVSHATRNLVPSAWWGGLAATLPSGATILQVTKATPSAPWTAPSVWKHWFELGLLQSEDIDGLAVDIARERVLFSCTGNSQPNQFMVLDYGTDGGPPTPQVAKKPDATPVSTAVGAASNDDVDAICTLDPQTGTLPPPYPDDDFGSSCGTPENGLLGVPSVHASAYRRFGGGRFFDATIVGWPPVTGITPGIAALFVTIGNDLTLFPVGPIFLRDTTPTLPGDPITQPLPIPFGYALSGFTLTFRWVAIDVGFTELAEAWPVKVIL